MARQSKDQHGNDLRAALTSFMEAHGFTVSRWCKAAGVPESALRNFLKGRSHTLTHQTLLALAGAAQVSFGSLVSSREDWGRTETVNINVAVNAQERPGESMFIPRSEQFSIRVPSLGNIAEVTKFGAYIEDESASAMWPAGSVLVCIELDFLAADQKNLAPSEPGDFFVTLESVTRYSEKDGGRIKYVCSNVRKFIQEGQDSYLVSCARSLRYYSALKLRRSILHDLVTESIVTGDNSEITMIGKVVASFSSHFGR
jgi:transcriptional regulator with XRE-family HTH domain